MSFSSHLSLHLECDIALRNPFSQYKSTAADKRNTLVPFSNSIEATNRHNSKIYVYFTAEHFIFLLSLLQNS